MYLTNELLPTIDTMIKNLVFISQVDNTNLIDLTTKDTTLSKGNKINTIINLPNKFILFLNYFLK